MLDLFDKVPVLLYSCEVWSYENVDAIERVHLRFLKIILNMKTSAPNFMVYGECGRFPLAIIIKSRMVSFWSKLILGKDSKLCFILYNF